MRVNIEVDSAGGNGPQSIGYVTDLRVQGSPSALRKSFSVRLPVGFSKPTYSPLQPSQGVMSVVGVIRSVTWSGAHNDVIKLAFVVSGDARTVLTNLAHQSGASVQEIGWWIGAYDNAQRCWYQAFYPKAPAKLQAKVSNCIVSSRAETMGTTSLYSVSLELCAPNDPVSLWRCPRAGSSTVMSWGSSPRSQTPQTVPVITVQPNTPGVVAQVG